MGTLTKGSSMATGWRVEAATHLAQALELYDAHSEELFSGSPLTEARAMLTALGKPVVARG